MADVHPTLVDRTVVTENGCVEWTATRNKLGYGTTKVAGKSKLAHRLSYERSVGPIPEGLCVLHRCDNPPCINPDHLFLGTRYDNTQDMINKGRMRKASGENSGRSKFTAEQILKIRDDKRSGKIIADEYGVAKSSITRIRSRINWKHLP